MSDWKTGFQEAVKDMIFTKGTPVDDRESPYGWIDGAYKEICSHFDSCGIASSSDLEEAEWVEFVDTFYEGDTTRYGVEAKFTCNCGKYTDKLFRYEGRLSDAITDLLR